MNVCLLSPEEVRAKLGLVKPWLNTAGGGARTASGCLAEA